MRTFPSTFGEEALLLDGFLRDINSRNHALHGAYHGRYNKQTERKTIYSAWNLTYATSMFGDKLYSFSPYKVMMQLMKLHLLALHLAFCGNKLPVVTNTWALFCKKHDRVV